jgi:hypothetical protein
MYSAHNHDETGRAPSTGERSHAVVQINGTRSHTPVLLAVYRVQQWQGAMCHRCYDDKHSVSVSSLIL